MKKPLRREYFRFLNIPAVLALVSTLLVLVPLGGMFLRMDARSIRDVFGQEGTLAVLGRSVTASGLTTAITLPLAWLMAWCVERTAMGGKRLFRVLVTLPMLIPSVSIGMGAVLLLGNNGILTNLLGMRSGNVYGLQGIVWGSVMYSLPPTFLMIENILKFEDSAPYDAARVLGISKWHQFTAITLPYLRKPLLVAAFSVFTLSFTDYGVPLMVGGKYKTLPVVMYQEVIGQLNFGRGCVYGSILLIPAVVGFLLEHGGKNGGNTAFVARPFQIRKNTGRDLLATFCAGALALFSLLPILSFLVMAFVKRYPGDLSLTFDNILRTMELGGGKYLLNSVAVSLLCGLCGVAFAVPAAYCTARTHSAAARYLHLLCMSIAAVPGIVLGLSYVLLFKGSPLYGTLGILVAVNTVHFFASPYLMIYTSFTKLNGNLEAVGATLGIGRWHLLKDVMLPMCIHTVREMFSYFFVNSMMTISAVSFLANSRTKPLALMINQFEAQAQMECAAVVALIILLVNLTVKLLPERRPKRKKES